MKQTVYDLKNTKYSYERVFFTQNDSLKEFLEKEYRFLVKSPFNRIP